MQPHVDYMRVLAAQFSGTTGVPLSSLGIVSDNPSSAEAIYAGKEDAVVDIQSFINAFKRCLANVSAMVIADLAALYVHKSVLSNIDKNCDRNGLKNAKA